MTGVLSGYRVLDFARYVAGPFCGALLADLGADVIRVEPPEGASDRFLMPLRTGLEGAQYHQVNRGKRSFTLDLKAPAADEVFRRLVASADVVIANLPPVALAKMGLDYEALCRINPKIILTTITAYGTSGPYANNIGFDGTGQAMSGAMALTGTPQQPYRSAVAYVDYSTALSAALATVAALWRRVASGSGEHVECSLLGTALTMTNPMLIEEATESRHRIAIGNRSPISAPSDLFRTRDGWIMIQLIGTEMFRRWTQLVGAPELASDPRFADDQSRGDHGEELSAITSSWTANKSTDECLALLRSARLTGSAMLRPAEVLSAPAVATGGFVSHVQDAAGNQIPLVSPPFTFSILGAETMRPAPLLGEHTHGTLLEIGFNLAEIEELRRAGVISVQSSEEKNSRTSENLGGYVQ
jgi:crotonobetainyl-CoA:carnitine CoA-transferase CaiB-like acyl-CoA transferase